MSGERASVPTCGQHRTGPGFVYFVRVAGSELVKIGKAGNVAARLRTLQAGAPEPLESLHTVEATCQTGAETYFHRRFAAQRVRGEWFSLTAEDLDAVRAITSYCEACPEPVKPEPRPKKVKPELPPVRLKTAEEYGRECNLDWLPLYRWTLDPSTYRAVAEHAKNGPPCSCGVKKHEAAKAAAVAAGRTIL